MNIETLRRIDRWLGVPLCAVLTALRKLGARFARDTPSAVGRIVFVKLAEQGSTVLAYPALRRAVEMVGAANVWFVVFEPNRFILDAMEVIPRENVITIRIGSLGRTLLSTLAAVRRLRRLRTDAAIDLEFFARGTAALLWLSGAKRRVGLHAYAGDGAWRGDLLTHRLIYNPHLHTSQLFRLEVDALEHAAERFPACAAPLVPLDELPRPRLAPRPAEVGEVEALICRATGQQDAPPLVLLNANCGDLLPLRRWPDASYVTLARRLLERHRTLFVGFTGAPGEAHAVQRLVAAVDSPRCVSFAGRTSMRQLLILYELAEVLVTNDSGPAHFAALTSVDVVALFGPETPRLFGGLSRRAHVFWAGTACSPCVSAYNGRVSTCRDNICMQQIGVEQVYAKVCQILLERALGAELTLPFPDPDVSLDPLDAGPPTPAGPRAPGGEPARRGSRRRAKRREL